MKIQNIQKQKGFTLVEIAIVLVIIGLLLGGVLKGQELITNAKIKSVTSDFDGISAAYYAYQDRTGLVAGDSATPGTIDDAYFWNDLRTEGFITGVATTTNPPTDVGPTHSLDGPWTAVPGDVVASAMFTKNHICAANIEMSVAEGIDRKLDDGIATSGIVRSGTTDATAVGYSAVIAEREDPVFLCREL